MKSLVLSTFLSVGIYTLLSLPLQGVELAASANTQAPVSNNASDKKSADTPQTNNKSAAKSVIFMIGDGMGLAHVSGAISASPEPLALQRAEAIGLIRTYSANRFTTDSAAAGTALSSGKKTKNGMVGQNPKGEAIPSMLSYAMQDGKSTGIVVTSSITHATPASFYGHNKTRRDEFAIAKDLLDSNIDVAVGGGRRFLEERTDGEMLTDQLKAKGYEIAYTMDDVLATPKGSRLIGLLSEVALPKVTDGRGPMLAQATEKALELLSVNPQGFILMVEGSQIDWAGHRNEWEYALNEIIDFDAAIKVALDYADANPDTLVVITADHETGGLSLVDGDLAKRTVKTHWAVKSHTGIMVPVYAYGHGSENFIGIYENTDVFERILEALGISNEAVPAVKNSTSLTVEADLSSPGASIGAP